MNFLSFTFVCISESMFKILCISKYLKNNYDGVDFLVKLQPTNLLQNLTNKFSLQEFIQQFC